MNVWMEMPRWGVDDNSPAAESRALLVGHAHCRFMSILHQINPLETVLNMGSAHL